MSFADDFETDIQEGGSLYHVSGKATSAETFYIQILSENGIRRWSGSFSAPFIDDITVKSGSSCRIGVFWRMMVHAAGKKHKSVSLSILTPNDIRALNTICTDRLYLVLSAKSEYETLKYPLPLSPNPLSIEELTHLCESLYQDNVELRQKLEISQHSHSIEHLENQITHLNDSLEEVRSEKDHEIYALQRKLRYLKKKVRSKKETSFELYDRLNATNSSKFHSKAKTPKPNYGRKSPSKSDYSKQH